MYKPKNFLNISVIVCKENIQLFSQPITVTKIVKITVFFFKVY